MIDIEIKDIHVAKPCPVCHTMPRMFTASGWKNVRCDACGIGYALAHGTMNEAIAGYNKVVDGYNAR